MISVFDKKEDCCGCTACESICPERAITMKPDKEGFLYPEINQGLCIDCNLCRSVCPIQNRLVLSDRLHDPRVFAVKHKKEQVRMSSASGGAYTAISDYILKSSGVVYGAEFDDDFCVRHNRATNAEVRNKFKGSKYIQSDTRGIFKQIEEDLIKGNNVLFTGTACQVAGLRKFLEAKQVKTNKLTTNDIICHGVPSPLLWQGYLNFIQKKNKLKSYTFRYKQKGWHGYNVKTEFTNGKLKINTPDIKVFANLFSSDLALRPCCYYCCFANLQRPSDILIGDFWGIEKTMPEFDDNKGVSLVLINSQKGEEIFQEIKNELIVRESNIKDCLQRNLQYPTKKREEREQFWQDYYKYGFEYIAQKYAGYSFRGRVKSLLKDFLKKIGLLMYVKKLVR